MPGSMYGACRRLTAHDARGLPVGNDDVFAACDASLATPGDLGASIVDVELPRRFVPLGDLVGKIIATHPYRRTMRGIYDTRGGGPWRIS